MAVAWVASMMLGEPTKVKVVVPPGVESPVPPPVTVRSVGL